jgi:hypothetical protein
MMFDTNYLDDKHIPIFFDAANKIANLYNIQIEVYTVDDKGKVINQRDNIPIDGNYTNIVPIAQFGLQHFVLILIDNNTGCDFIPAIPIDGKLTTITDIILDNELFVKLNDDLIENLNKIQDINKQLNQLNEEYNNSITTKEYIEKSNKIKDKDKCLHVFNKEINKTVSLIKNLVNKITDYKNVNLSINYIIKSNDRKQ